MAIDYSQIQSKFGDSLENYVNFASYCRWYPDKFLDLCKGPNNGFKLDMDERVLMRSLARFSAHTVACREVQLRALAHRLYNMSLLFGIPALLSLLLHRRKKMPAKL